MSQQQRTCFVISFFEEDFAMRSPSRRNPGNNTAAKPPKHPRYFCHVTMVAGLLLALVGCGGGGDDDHIQTTTGASVVGGSASTATATTQPNEWKEVCPICGAACIVKDREYGAQNGSTHICPKGHMWYISKGEKIAY